MLHNKLSVPEFEAVWCKVILLRSVLKVGLIYRPPTQYETMPTLLIDHIDENCVDSEPTIILGDFNYFVQGLAEGLELGIFDHKIINGCLAIEEAKPSVIACRNYKTADFAQLNRELARVDWYCQFPQTTIESMWCYLLKILSELVEKYIPLRTFVSSVKPKVSLKVRKSCKKVYNLHVKKRNSPNDPELIQQHKEAVRNCRLLKREEKFRDERKVLEAGNSGSFWTYVKNKMTYKSSIPCLLDSNNCIIADPSVKADMFNEFFQSVFTVDNGASPPTPNTLSNSQLIFVAFTSEMTYEALKKLSTKTSSGPDTIPPILFKKLAVPLAEPLSIIFNCSFQNSILPSDWLAADIIPIFKNKGSQNKVTNYRPVSLTSVACKVMESLIANELRDHVSKMISDDQHGFLSGKSTVTQLLGTINDWTRALDDGYVIDVLYIDIAKAFDSVSHPKLLHKLEMYGVGGLMLCWIRAFLSNRIQRVKIDGAKSSFRNVTSGVPQGSVLGPLLFLIYINDLPQVVQTATVKLFADDCKLYMAFQRKSSNRHIFQTEIDNIKVWADNNQLNIAFEKCQILHLGYGNPLHDYYFGETPIPSVNTIRDLGVEISRDMKFHVHINQIVKSATAIANQSQRCFMLKNKTFLTKMFKIFVRPKLEYASQVWNPVYIGDINRLERVQRSFTRKIPGLNKCSYAKVLTLEANDIFMKI